MRWKHVIVALLVVTGVVVGLTAALLGKWQLLGWLALPLIGLGALVVPDLLGILLKAPREEETPDDSMEEHIRHYREYRPTDPNDMAI